MTGTQCSTIMQRVERYWRFDPNLTRDELNDWQRTFGRFPVEAVSEAVDHLYGASPRKRPYLGKVLEKVQEIQRSKIRLPAFVAPVIDVAPPSVMRVGLAQARAALAPHHPQSASEAS